MCVTASDLFSSKSIVILGSKPGALLPAVYASLVFAANNAVELAVPYREKYNSRIIGFVPSVELRRHEHIQQSFIKAQPDEIFLIGDDGNDPVGFVKNTLGLTAEKVSIIGPQERYQLLVGALGWRRGWVVMLGALWKRGAGYFFHNLFLSLLGKGSMEWLAQSTGLNAVFYGLKHFPNAEKIITAGIGLQGGEHFNKVGEFTNKTAKADRMTMQHWPFARRPTVYTTDDVMHTLGKVPKWEGDIFYFQK